MAGLYRKKSTAKIRKVRRKRSRQDRNIIMTDLYKKKHIGKFAKTKDICMDFSLAGIRGQLFREALLKTYVLYPAVIALLAALSMVLFGPSLPLSAALISGLFVAAGGLLHMSKHREMYATRHLARLREILAGRIRDSIHHLRRDLDMAGSAEGLRQLKRLDDKYTGFRDLLNRKLNENDINYDRYLGMIEQVYLAVMNNLNSISKIMNSISAMDLISIAPRIQELEQLPLPSAAERKELNALHKRNLLLVSQQQKINILLSQNEEAMTAIDRLTAALTEMNSSLSGSTVDMTEALEEVERLTKQRL